MANAKANIGYPLSAEVTKILDDACILTNSYDFSGLTSQKQVEMAKFLVKLKLPPNPKELTRKYKESLEKPSQ
jgi:hypothetical protein